MVIKEISCKKSQYSLCLGLKCGELLKYFHSNQIYIFDTQNLYQTEKY